MKLKTLIPLVLLFTSFATEACFSRISPENYQHLINIEVFDVPHRHHELEYQIEFPAEVKGFELLEARYKVYLEQSLDCKNLSESDCVDVYIDEYLTVPMKLTKNGDQFMTSIFVSKFRNINVLLEVYWGTYRCCLCVFNASKIIKNNLYKGKAI